MSIIGNLVLIVYVMICIIWKSVKSGNSNVLNKKEELCQNRRLQCNIWNSIIIRPGPKVNELIPVPHVVQKIQVMAFRFLNISRKY